MPQPECPFCNPDPTRAFLEAELIVGLWDGFPVAAGHALLVTRRHAARGARRAGTNPRSRKQSRPSGPGNWSRKDVALGLRYRPEYRRVLFVAHREEILNQALGTFRRIRPEARLGHYTGDTKDPNAHVVFASIQTLSRREHLERFSPEAFDYLVVDEFHHAAAASYRKLITYFQPEFLLGLTATPERTDVDSEGTGLDGARSGST
jgi:Type III restriction enzyme, res subunit